MQIFKVILLKSQTLQKQTMKQIPAVGWFLQPPLKCPSSYLGCVNNSQNIEQQSEKNPNLSTPLFFLFNHKTFNLRRILPNALKWQNNHSYEFSCSYANGI